MTSSTGSKAVVLTGAPVIAVLAEMELKTPGVIEMARWVEDRYPDCMPEDWLGTNPGVLFPYDLRVEEDGHLIPDNELLVELAGRKCIAAGTMISTDRGVRPIERVEPGSKVIVEGGAHSVSAIIDGGEKPVVKVVTRAGYTVRCTPDHRLLTTNGWKAAGSLTQEDTLVISAGNTCQVTKADDWLAGYCCGLLLGDGSFAGEQRRWANVRLFGAKKALMPLVEKHTGAKASPYRNGEALSINSEAWALELHRYGIGPSSRTVMPLVECASVEFRAGVIGGMFDTDGSLGVKFKPNGSLETRRMVLNSSDRSSLEAVQRMLLEFGIFSRIKLDKPEGYQVVIDGVETQANSASWKLTVTGPGFKRFFDVIGTEREERRMLADAAIAASTKWYEKLAYGGVASVTPAGVSHVYDLSVNDVHRFSANGIVAHNCYNSFGLKAGRKSNAEYIKNMLDSDMPHTSVAYHAKMTFFFAGLSRRVSHELIRNYVGADRSEEGCPSQESTRYVEHAGRYVQHPGMLETWEKEIFRAEVQANYTLYRNFITSAVAWYAAHHNDEEPRGMDRKRIYERASSLLVHSCETSWIWTTNPIALAKLIRERAGEAADLEFQRFARLLAHVCVKRWPNLFPQFYVHAAASAATEGQ